MTVPLVSVMIPVYNRADLVGEAIRSVLAQTYPHFELIVHDDASTDSSLAVAKSFHDPRLRVIHTARNHGMLGGWNYLLHFGRGRYVKQMGSDDLLSPDCLAKQVEALQAHPQAALVTCRRRVIDSRGRMVKYYALSAKSRVLDGPTHAHWILTNLRENKIGEPAAVMFPRRLLAKAGNFDTRFSQFADFEMWLRLLEFGELVYLHEPLCSFREHAGSNTSAAVRDGRFVSEIYHLIAKYYSSPHFRRVFHLSESDRRNVTAQKTLDTLVNIRDLLKSGRLPQSLRYASRLFAQVSPGYVAQLSAGHLLSKAGLI